VRNRRHVDPVADLRRLHLLLIRVGRPIHGCAG
jgi:hypothetical protein